MARTTSASRGMDILSQPARWFQRMSWETRWLLVICVIALALRLWPLNGASSDYDEGVYWQSLRALAHGQPLFSGVFSSQPPFFLLSVYPLYLLFGQTLSAARLAVTLYSLVGVVALYVAGRRLGGSWVGLIAALLLAVDPLYLTESHTLQAEAPAIGFEILAVALAVASLGARRRRTLLAALAGVALGLGMMIKLFDVVALIPVFAFVAQPFFGAFLDERGRLAAPPLAAIKAGLREAVPACLACLAGTLLAILVVALPFAANWRAAYDQVIRFHTSASQAAHGSLRGNLAAIYHVRSEYLLWLAALAGVVLALWRRRWLVLPLVLWLLATVALLLQQQPLFLHHMSLLAPPLALLAALVPAFATPPNVGNVFGNKNAMIVWGVRFALLFVIAVGVTGVFIGGKDDARAAQSPPTDKLKLAALLQAVTLPSDYVVTDDQYIAGLADRNVLPQLVDTSSVRIQSGYLTASQLEALITSTDTRTILFASGRFDQIPGFRAWVEAHFVAAPQVGNGHMLYVKVPQGPAPV